jgi:hypothetical protein
MDRILLELVPVAPEFFFRKPHPLLASQVLQARTHLIIRLKNPPERCFYLPLPNSPLGVKFRSGNLVWRSISHRVKAPALQAQSPRTPRGQIQVMGHHNVSEPVG